MEMELEVKILNMDIDKLEDKAIGLGARLIGDEEQVNSLIDSKERPIKSYLDAYLRIRETRDLLNNKKSLTLTLKKNMETEGIRKNQELNTEIEDKEVMLEILKDLGFDKLEVGYKKRRSYDLRGARLDFDRWDEETYPYPYMEIEVEDRNKLDEIINLLEIPKGNISTRSIKELKEDLRKG